MTEFEYDCYRKKTIARSAAHRVCGSKSKKCNLSTDNMSEKQWNERCGSVMSYNIGKPMVWAEFIKLPKDLKEEYMNKLIDKYSCNAKSLADMFGVCPATIFRTVKSDNLNVQFLKGRHPYGDKEQAFKLFLEGRADEVVNETEDQSHTDDVIVENHEAVIMPDSAEDNKMTIEDEQKQKTRLDSFTMNFSGEVNVEMIANSLRYILAGGGNAKIQVVCELC